MNMKYFFNENNKTKDDIKNIMINHHEEMKQRKLLSKSAPTTDDIFYSDYMNFIIKFCGMIPHKCCKKGTKVLDLGCGEGRLLLLLNSLGFKTYGVDAYVFDGKNTEDKPREPLIKKYFEEYNIKVKKIDLLNEKIPFPDDYFDMITCTEVIEHFHNSPKPCIQEMRRVLKDGGYVLLTTPNYASLKNRIKAILGKSNHCKLGKYYNHEVSVPPSIEFVGHVREFTLSEVKMIFIWQGFKIVKAITYALPCKNIILKIMEIIQYVGLRLKSNIFILEQK